MKNHSNNRGRKPPIGWLAKHIEETQERIKKYPKWMQKAMKARWKYD